MQNFYHFTWPIPCIVFFSVHREGSNAQHWLKCGASPLPDSFIKVSQCRFTEWQSAFFIMLMNFLALLNISEGDSIGYFSAEILATYTACCQISLMDSLMNFAKIVPFDLVAHFKGNGRASWLYAPRTKRSITPLWSMLKRYCFFVNSLIRVVCIQYT